jgi:predicted mannosyl-3-phosphoglycerate phosphatase (HAD superfamily)
MNDNTILRIKVPAHLYESVKAQLTLNEAKKGGHNYGAGMEVVKEKKIKTPKDGMKKIEEMNHDKKDRSLDELKAAKAKLDKKIEEMSKPKDAEIKEYVGMSPDQVELVNTLGQLIAGGAASAAVIMAAKNLLAKIKGEKKD